MPAAEIHVWTIAQLTRRIKHALEHEIGEVWVSGEVSNWKVAASGHAYFTLKDEDSQIDAVMFRGALGKVRFEPGNGLEVLAHGRVTVYEKRGNCQIVLSELQPKGLGALQLRFEQLKRKLAAEGLFDEARKKALPLLPRRIGIVTSPTGAAIRDMLNVLGRRFENVHVIVAPASVQGGKAAPEIARAIGDLDRFGVDVMIVGRGGGSLEDLWPFNEEAVVRAIAAAETPVVSAVGHEIDFTLSDFAADLRAPTPSAAAELVVRERHALAERVAQSRRRMAAALAGGLKAARARLALARSRYAFARPGELLRQRRQRFDELRMRLDAATAAHAGEARRRLVQARRALALLAPAARVRHAHDRLAALRARLAGAGGAPVLRARHRAEHASRALLLLTPAARVAGLHERRASLAARLHRAGAAAAALGRARLSPLAAQLDALSPLAILARGYAVAWQLPEGRIVRRVSQLAAGDLLRVRFGEGAAEARVERIEAEI